METEEELYEVECIVDRRRCPQGQLQYLIRWRGFGAESDTWEPEEHLFNTERGVNTERHRVLQRSTHRLLSPAPSPSPALRDLNTSGIKILVPKSPRVRDQDQDRVLQATGPETECVASKPSAPAEERQDRQDRQDRQERARMGTRPRPGINQNQTHHQARLTALRPTDAGVAKRRHDDRFDKRLRVSVRQTESAYRYRHLVVKKQENHTHIILSTRNSAHNTLNPEVMREVQAALSSASSDDSKLVLVSSVSSVFCGGLDFLWLLPKLTEDRKRESARMAESLRSFVHCLLSFPKPLVAAVNGPAVGLGAAILGLCDVVWANEKAWIQTPYAHFGHTPDGCSSYTFPLIMGQAAASELLLSCRRLTAQEACSKGLVSQVLWPHTFNQEVQARIRELLLVDAQVLKESKSLIRSWSRSGLEQTNERECEALKRIWATSEWTETILDHLQTPQDY